MHDVPVRLNVSLEPTNDVQPNDRAIPQQESAARTKPLRLETWKVDREVEI